MDGLRTWLVNKCINAAVLLMPQRDKNAIAKIFREKLLRAQRSSGHTPEDETIPF